jgi:phospholipase/carboxylesterase
VRNMEDVHGDQEVLAAGEDLEDADRAVVMLHGRGASARSMLQLADRLPEEAAYFAPQASNRTWYPNSFLEPRERNQPHLDSALEKVMSIVEDAADSVGRENVVLLGFSQGACLASEFLASNPDRYGGLIALSGGLIGEEVQDFSGDLEQTPVFMGCADNDPHIPLERMEETGEVFQEMNADVEEFIFEGSYHGILDEEVEKAEKIVRR